MLDYKVEWLVCSSFSTQTVDKVGSILWKYAAKATFRLHKYNLVIWTEHVFYMGLWMLFAYSLGHKKLLHLCLQHCIRSLKEMWLYSIGTWYYNHVQRSVYMSMPVTVCVYVCIKQQQQKRKLWFFIIWLWTMLFCWCHSLEYDHWGLQLQRRWNLSGTC